MTEQIYHIKNALPELQELEGLIAEGRDQLRVDVPGYIQHEGVDVPFYVLEMGSTSPDAPALALIGGVHGVERIGTQIILSFLRTLLHKLEWDPVTRQQLDAIRLVMIPIVNPGGMWNNSRANPNGVDLMRNAPVETEHRPPFMVGGQRLTRFLPWYRGKNQAPMEMENQFLTRAIESRLYSQPVCISLDCHSGFGYRDRIWFPYARSLEPWPGLSPAYGLTRLFEHSYPSHDLYLFEPQAHSYTTSGDVWDYLYDGYVSHNPDGLFVPLTLEMGSWLWLKKNPRQAFRYHSFFNPTLPHRHLRILRRHLTLLDFLMSAVQSAPHWAPATEPERAAMFQQALERWYPNLANESYPLKL
ncbi:MAG: zinc carboxypeptidase [Oceanospirillaceae bacterium]|nr:zinc carboxypeptidase [Oceanospirillaceae bacterium]